VPSSKIIILTTLDIHACVYKRHAGADSCKCVKIRIKPDMADWMGLLFTMLGVLLFFGRAEGERERERGDREGWEKVWI